MALTHKIDLDTIPLDIHAKIQVCMSVHSAVRVRQTDTHTHTHRQRQNYYTRRVRDVGVISLAHNAMFKIAIVN